METCKFYVSFEQPECGEEAVTHVTTQLNRKGDRATVPLCHTHGAYLNRQYAKMRTESKVGTSGSST